MRFLTQAKQWACAIVVALCAPVLWANPGQGHGKEHGRNTGYEREFAHEERMAAPNINSQEIRQIFSTHRNYWSSASSLPPGIQKKLARGKPLPPGIAKKLDNRLLAHLPHYQGYDWQQAGRDLILVTATGLIYQVLSNVFE